MRLALAIGSFVILAVHGVVFYAQFFHAWERNQTAYFDQARGLAKTPAERAALEARSPRIEQIIVTQFGDTRVDRCTTCHIAADDPRFEKYAHPMKSHPYSEALGDRQVNGRWERRHKFADFGCTVCHDGQGRGLKPHYSHGEDHYWPDPMLGNVTQAGWRQEYLPKLKGREYMQANCALCHTEDTFAGTPEVTKGRQLFFSSNCYGCHKVEGLSDGAIGPDLTESGKKFKIDYLWESIADPRANSATSVMPKFRLNDGEIRSLVIFLKSRRGMNFAETEIQRYRAKLNEGVAAPAVTTAAPPASPVAFGEKLVADRACLACHKLGDRDGGIAPDLTWSGLMRDEKWLYDHFKDPRALVSDSIMPSFRFPEPEFRALSAFLASRTAKPAAMPPADAYKTFCLRCHGEKGDGHGPIAIYLDPYPRDLTKAGFMNSKPLDRLGKSIKEGVAGTSMPAWGKILDDSQVSGLLEYVQTTFVKQARTEVKPRKAPDTNPVAFTADSAARGEATFVLRCAGCHGRKADGKGPNSLDILPRPRNLRNAAFVNSVSDRRLFEAILYGVQGSAMPSWVDYGLSHNDVGDLINFIRGIHRKPQGSAHARAN